MAVPRKKQSHSRTNKRRSSYTLETPTYNSCPQCHTPRMPHRVCPQCGFYGGRRVIAAKPSGEGASPQSQ